MQMLAPAPSHVALTTIDVTDDAYAETDQESYICMRTDEEADGSTDWEETCQRWINR